MMHHPNMHHQPMSGHPAQHHPGHQGMPAHHQIPHQMHRENRHIPMHRMGLGHTGSAAGIAHGPPMGAMGAMHHGPAQRPHHIRPMHGHPAQHHGVLPQMKQFRRGGYLSTGYSANGPNVVYQQPIHMHQHPPPQERQNVPKTNGVTAAPPPKVEGGKEKVKGETAAAGGDDCPSIMANSKEKTPMCLVNELARYNKIKHQYRLTSEMGPAHKKVFTVTLRLGDTEEYTAEGSSIKRAQHCAASAALGRTRFAAPPPRATPATASANSLHNRSSGTVMPTVELNALAMKLCQPAVYTSLPGSAPRVPRPRLPPPLLYPPPPPHALPPPPPNPTACRVRVSVGAREWVGAGCTPQAARHDAAARALHDLRPEHAAGAASAVTATTTTPAAGTADTDADVGVDLLNSEVKSPVSLVHEIALKRNLTVIFTVKSERGPPHMRVFITVCTVGDMVCEGEGNGKKVSKRRAAEAMLTEMKKRWPPAPAPTARPPPLLKRRPHTTKKKPRNLVKEADCSEGGGGGGDGAGSGGGGEDNPISVLAAACHSARARSPQYRVVEERGAARRREFLVECCAPPHTARGHGPNKKTAKRRSAANVLLAMEAANKGTEASEATSATGEVKTEAKRKEGESTEGSETRQPVPGVLLMDYQQRTVQANGISEENSVDATSESDSTEDASKDQLMYLAKLLGFTVQFSDFPKRNHGEYLSLVSLGTVPPLMAHGAGASTAASHRACARAALAALAAMGLGEHSAPAQPPALAAHTASPPNGIAD